VTKTIHFNTGRGYSAIGQQITATLQADNVVTFHDHSRMISGEFELGAATFNQAEVMRRYDRYEAPQTSRSWADAFQRGGCNAKYEG
jgi:hypothetical protein